MTTLYLLETDQNGVDLGSGMPYWICPVEVIKPSVGRRFGSNWHLVKPLPDGTAREVSEHNVFETYPQARAEAIKRLKSLRSRTAAYLNKAIRELVGERVKAGK